MENEKQCPCKKIPRIKFFFYTKGRPYRCKKCNKYGFIEDYLVEAYVDSGFYAILMGFLIFKLYGSWWLLVLLFIPIVFRLIEIFLFKVKFISEAEKRAKEKIHPPGIGTLVVFILIFIAIVFYNYIS